MTPTSKLSLHTAVLALLSLPVAAQQGGIVLPVPPGPFEGTINLRAKDSKPDFPQPVQAPQGAPNVLLILLHDLGYGATSTADRS